MSLEKINTEPQAKTLKQLLEDIPKDAKHKLTVSVYSLAFSSKIVILCLQTCLVPTNQSGPEWEQIREIEFELYRKYQMSVHNDPPARCTILGFTKFLVNSPLQVFVTDSNTEAEQRITILGVG